ncbi:hypothetical protein NC651_007063 [Populus alba x Populus x berolinensis]|nr:hypothetical protein NC651_007063 [Populus alba x Populus x berolinensis]
MRCGPSGLNSWWDPNEVPTAHRHRNDKAIPVVQLFLPRKKMRKIVTVNRWE